MADVRAQDFAIHRAGSSDDICSSENLFFHSVAPEGRNRFTLAALAAEEARRWMGIKQQHQQQQHLFSVFASPEDVKQHVQRLCKQSWNIINLEDEAANAWCKSKLTVAALILIELPLFGGVCSVGPSTKFGIWPGSFFQHFDVFGMSLSQ